MVRLLLILLLISSSLTTTAQGYHRTLVPGRSWDMFSCNTMDNSLLPCQSGRRYFLKDTTVSIDGYDYHPLFYYSILSDNTEVYYDPFYVDNIQEHVSLFSMREDTITGKVYVLNVDGVDEMVADYSLEIGDVFQGYEYSTVVDVGEAILLNGEPRKVVVLENGFYFLEGVGPSSGLPNNPIVGLGWWYDVRCVMDGTESLWNFRDSSPFSSGNIFSCIGTLSVNDVPAQPSISVFPNPALELITMELSPVLGVGAMLEIFSITGQGMFRQEQVPVTLQIDISGWPRGVYLYAVTYKDGQKSRGTLLAQ